MRAVSVFIFNRNTGVLVKICKKLNLVSMQELGWEIVVLGSCPRSIFI